QLHFAGDGDVDVQQAAQVGVGLLGGVDRQAPALGQDHDLREQEQQEANRQHVEIDDPRQGGVGDQVGVDQRREQHAQAEQEHHRPVAPTHASQHDHAQD